MISNANDIKYLVIGAATIVLLPSLLLLNALLIHCQIIGRHASREDLYCISNFSPYRTNQMRGTKNIDLRKFQL